ncbi:MAG TPA: protein kinase [Polyangiaceae bacterium]|nr:protein kinase [Polyangiaceae bacterium]
MSDGSDASKCPPTLKAARAVDPGAVALTTTLPPDPRSAPPAAPPAAPTRSGRGLSAGAKIKHYELIRPLGKGGMGQVYLARDTKLGRLVAIKRLLTPDDRGARRVLVEARATARCRHENIVVIYEVDEHQGEPYLVLEYVEGVTLRAWMAARGAAGAAGPAAASGAAGAAPGRVPPGLAVELMLPVVRALACAHEQGVVHRDLKPENILLTDAGAIKVLDFGLAKPLAGGATSASEGAGASGASGVKGTLLYMAPEQWQTDDLDGRVDLWAVGLLLYELCAGAHPLGPVPLATLADLLDPHAPMPSLLGPCPEAGALAMVVERCLQKRREDRYGSARELLAALEALRAGPGALAEGVSPFPGLSAFQEADAGRFFGRDADVAAVAQRLRHQPLVAVVGASGAGKSSFVRAGLIPALKRSGERWEAFVVRPGRRPLLALGEVWARACEAPSAGAGASTPGGSDRTEGAAALGKEPGALGAALRARCRRGHGRALLFVDQFEELYTLGASADERAAFLACLEGVADDASSPLRVLLALRADFLDRTAEDRRFAAELARGLVLLPPMGRGGLHEALVRPVEAAGYRFESEALVGRMLDALEGTMSPLPLLQFVAFELWEGRDRAKRLLTEASYERLGGVEGALSAHADAVLGRLPPREQRLCREVLVRLVTPERTRAVVGLDELRQLGPAGEVEPVVQHLVEARLLSVDRGPERDGATVELVHESLIERWPQLGAWLEASAQDAQFLARLRTAAQQWEASGEAEGLLWREGAALEARAWLARCSAECRGEGVGLSERERRYLQAIVALVERARRRKRRVVAGMIAVLSAIALVVSALAVRANRAAARAEARAVQARNATRLAVARELLPSDPTTALTLVRELEPPEVARGWADVARVARKAGVSRRVFPHPDRLLKVVFSPDGKRLATASFDGALRVWNADGVGEPLVLRGHQGEVYALSFSPDGKRLASASDDKTVRVWDADGAGEPLVLRGHEDGVHSAAFSPDGRRLVTASRDKTARVWDADSVGEPLVLRGHEDWVTSAAFSPDGKRLVTASKDHTVRVWDADGVGEPLVLRAHEGEVWSAAFSPDGRRLVTASADKTVRVWDADGVGEPLVLRGHEEVVSSAAFSPDGQRLVSASGDNTVRVWDANGKGEPLVLRGHESWIFVAAFSPDGRRLVSASLDGTVRVWGADGAGQPLVLRGHEGAVWSAAFSPDGRRLVSASVDRTLRVWEVDGAGEPLVLRGHERGVTSAAFSLDGKRIITASQDRTTRVWSADGVGEPLVLRGHEGTVWSAAFSPDGRRLVTASTDKTARVWSADGSGEPLVLRGHEDEVWSVAFSPDGKRIVSASEDRTVRVWSADGAGEPLVLRGHEEVVSSVAFSPDGKRLVSASDDKTVRVWNADGAGEPLVLRGHEGAVWSAAFSPDGKRIVSASLDKTVRVWGADGAGEPLVLRGHEGAVWSAKFSPDGKRVLSASMDNTARLWADLEPLRSPDDPTLWAATTYCLPAPRRVALLNVPESQARADEQACQRHVAASPGRP